MKHIYNRIISTIIVIPTIYLLIATGAIPLMEGYNVFHPYCDTEFADTYSPELFDTITTKHTKEDVISILGDPLSVYNDSNMNKIQVRFIYTNDGWLNRKDKKRSRYFVSDFAWYRSYIIFDELGQISTINSGWSYD